MDFRQKIYLLEDYPSETGPFLRAKPPLNKDVYLKFRGIHKHLQLQSHGTSSEREASRMTAIEVSKWWQKTGITLKSEYGLIYLIENCHHKWKVLFKQRLKITDAQKKSRTVFLANMEQPFWPVCPKYEKLMEKSADPRKKEDYEWLQRLKAGKPVSLGPPDRDYDQRINRRV